MLKQVMPHQLTDQQILYYHEAIGTDEHSGGLALVQRGIAEGHLGLFVWEKDECEMVIITEILTRPDGYKELLISMLAGTGGTAQWVEVVTEFIEEVAPSMYCDRTVAFVKKDLWDKFKQYGDVGQVVDELYVVIGKEPSEGPDQQR